MWLIAAMPEERVKELAPRFHSAVDRHAAQAEHQTAWRNWCESPDLVPGRFPGLLPEAPRLYSPLPAVAAFEALVGETPWDNLGAERINFYAAENYFDSVEPVCVLVRKGSPVAALFHGIGPARARLLPGWLGNFLLMPDEVRDLEPQINEALTMPAEEHARALQRIRDWLNAMGDSGDKEADQLISGPLRTWRAAVQANAGLCASQTWVT
jgi:hypothetical protein